MLINEFPTADASLEQNAVPWKIYALALVAGLAIGFSLRALNRFVFSSAGYIANIEGPLIIMAPAITYATIGGIFGFAYASKGWKWGIWISVIPWLYVVVWTSPLILKPHSETLGLFLFSNLVLAPIAACSGSYFGARLSIARRKTLVRKR